MTTRLGRYLSGVSIGQQFLIFSMDFCAVDSCMIPTNKMSQVWLHAGTVILFCPPLNFFLVLSPCPLIEHDMKWFQFQPHVVMVLMPTWELHSIFCLVHTVHHHRSVTPLLYSFGPVPVSSSMLPVYDLQSWYCGPIPTSAGSFPLAVQSFPFITTHAHTDFLGPWPILVAHFHILLLMVTI